MRKKALCVSNLCLSEYGKNKNEAEKPKNHFGKTLLLLFISRTVYMKLLLCYWYR